MRYYGIRKQKLCEKLNFHFEKCKKYLSYQCCLKKKTKEIRKMVYEDWFCTGVKRFHRDNGIPKGMYYVPFGIIMSDIISKENLPDLEQGLLALEKERSTHKYWGAAQSEEEIIHGLHNIDKTFSSWNSFINLGRFDFETDSVLKNIVSHFDVYLRNVNSSFLAIRPKAFSTISSFWTRRPPRSATGELYFVFPRIFSKYLSAITVSCFLAQNEIKSTKSGFSKLKNQSLLCIWVRLGRKNQPTNNHHY